MGIPSSEEEHSKEAVKSVILKEETDRTGSILKAGLHLGPDYGLELYVQYLWKQHTNWKTRPLNGRAPGLVPRLSID